MFCEKCGKEIDEKSLVCPYCGVHIDRNTESVENNMSSDERRKYVESVREKHLKIKKTIIIATPIIALVLIASGICQMFDENHSIKEEFSLSDIIIPFIVSAVVIIVGAFLFIREINFLKNEDKIEELAISLWKEEKAEVKKQAEQKAKEEQLKARINDASKPDLNADKKFEGDNAIVWVNTKDLLFQCSLPCGEFIMGKEKGLFFDLPKKVELKKKTKVYSFNDITDFDLIRSKSEKVVEDVRVYDSTASTTKEKIVNYFYDVEIKLNDLDCPFINIPFGEDEITAKNFEQVLNILLKK